jgi:hypothetical protein
LAHIDAAYHAFVARPTGVIARLFGHSCYRLDFSSQIDSGASWQLGVFAAHALHAAGRLAQEGETAAAVVWATGSMRPVDLTIGAVTHLAEKLARSLDRLKREVERGQRVLVALPDSNVSEVPAEINNVLAAHGIQLLALTAIEPLCAALELKLPKGLASERVTNFVVASQRFPRWQRWAAIAAGLSCICWATVFLPAESMLLLPWLRSGNQPSKGVAQQAPDEHPFDGAWRVNETSNGYCVHGSGVFWWFISHGKIDQRDRGTGGISLLGRVHFARPSRADPQRLITYLGKVEGNHGSGHFYVEGADCAGAFEMTMVSPPNR